MIKEEIIKLHTEQIIVEVLEIMLCNKQFILSVYKNNNCIGVVCFKDLITFLATGANKDEVFSHKLNFDMQSAMKALNFSLD